MRFESPKPLLRVVKALSLLSVVAPFNIESISSRIVFRLLFSAILKYASRVILGDYLLVAIFVNGLPLLKT